MAIYGDEHGLIRMAILRKSQEIRAALSGLVTGANPRKSQEVVYKVPCNGITPPRIHLIYIENKILYQP